MRTLDRGNLLVVPPRQIKNIYTLPEKRLDVLVTANESIQTKWTIWDNEVDGNPFHMDVIRNQITRNLGILTAPIASELVHAFEREWGTSTMDWKQVDPWLSSLRIVSGAANAAFCGISMCQCPHDPSIYPFSACPLAKHFITGRDTSFLKHLGNHAMCMFAGSLVISSTPRPLRFISGYLIGWTSYFFSSEFFMFVYLW